MAQSQNTVPTKSTGGTLTAAELNELASVQNSNSTDSETRLQTGETHAANTSNPHTVTKAQVGLTDADDTSDLAKPISTATQTALDLKADQTALTTHTGDTANPHVVTKAQVGLSNADNTSDANKPVSTAQQTALDLKADASVIADYLAPQTLTDAATIAYDTANGVNAAVTITADRTLGAIANAGNGMSGTLTVIQDGTGGWALSLNANQTDMLVTLPDIAGLAAGEVAKIAWETHNGTDFYLYITTQP